MIIIETDGIVLKTMDFKEKDSILTFLTRDEGKKTGVLHGGKSIKSGNAAKTELFVLNHFEFFEKIGSDLVSIRKCELLESYPLLRKTYSNFLHANYFSELLLHCEIPEIESIEYFNLLQKTISELSNSNNAIETKFNFELQLMKFLGIEPNLENCIHCKGDIWTIISGRRIVPKYSIAYQLDASLGGIRCPKCCVGNSFVANLNPGSMIFFYLRKKSLANNLFIKPTFNNLIELDKAFFIYFRYFFGKTIKSHSFFTSELWKN